jgi:hypothetical protein
MNRESAKRLALLKLRRPYAPIDIMSVLMDVQPMGQPGGRVYYLDLIYDGSWRCRLERWLRRKWYRLDYEVRRVRHWLNYYSTPRRPGDTR